MKKFLAIVIAVTIILTPFVVAESNYDFSDLTEDELVELIDAAQSELKARKAAETENNKNEESIVEGTVYVKEARLIVQSDDFKSLYPDALQAILVNDTNYDIKDVIVYFAAWDANNLPVLIKSQYQISNAAYVVCAKYTGVNMVPGGTFGETAGLKLDNSIKGITTVKAIVASYVTFDGVTWENPEYTSFVEEYYYGKKLSVEDMPDTPTDENLNS